MCVWGINPTREGERYDEAFNIYYRFHRDYFNIVSGSLWLVAINGSFLGVSGTWKYCVRCGCFKCVNNKELVNEKKYLD